MTHQTGHTAPGTPAGTLPAPSQRETPDEAQAGGAVADAARMLADAKRELAAAHADLDTRPATQLALIPADHLPGLELTPLGATITGTIDRDAIIGRLRLYRGFGASWRWLMGDLVCALAADHDGDLAYAWQQVADEDLDTRSSLSRSVAVARMVPLARRRARLSWSHHEAVLAADPRRQHSPPIEVGDDRDLLLGRAEAEGWTVDQLERHIAEMCAEPQEPLPDMPKRPAWKSPTFTAAIDRAFGHGKPVLAWPDGTVIEMPSVDRSAVTSVIEAMGREA